MEIDEKKKEFRARMAVKKREFFVFFLCVLLIVVALWPLITTTVLAGHTGVYFSRLFGGTVVDSPRGEGLRLKLPWDAIIQYDSRLQSKEYEIIALAKGGLNVKIKMAVLWHVKQHQAPALHVSAGPDYVTRVIDPAVMSSVRSVIGSLEQSQLYDGNPLYLQDYVLQLLKETLDDANFTIHSILFREVSLPEPMVGAISEKFVAEQNVLEARYRVLESIETFKRNFVNAESTRLAQSIVNEGMSEAYLRYLGINATLELAKSDNAKLVIIGDKDGMPLILNPDTMTVSPTLPSGLTPENYIPEGMEGARTEQLITIFERMQEYLGIMDKALGDLMNEFPQADPDIGKTNLPQDIRVPRASRGED